MSILTLCIPKGYTKDILAGPVSGTVTRVIDGDTLEVRARVWLDQEIIIKVRVAHVNAPELSRPKCAKERALAQRSKILLEALVGPGAVELRNIHYGKYAGRVIAEVTTRAGDVATALKAEKLSGKNWCSG